jgi:hypothetical protein
MNPEDLDRILLSEKQIEPSSTFEGDVMMRVRAQASYSRHIPFPWLPFATVTLVLTVLAMWLFPAGSVLRGTNWLSYTIGNWIMAPSDSTLRNVLLSAFASLVGTLLLIWFSLRLAGANR